MGGNSVSLRFSEVPNPSMLFRAPHCAELKDPDSFQMSTHLLASQSPEGRAAGLHSGLPMRVLTYNCGKLPIRPHWAREAGAGGPEHTVEHAQKVRPLSCGGGWRVGLAGWSHRRAGRGLFPLGWAVTLTSWTAELCQDLKTPAGRAAAALPSCSVCIHSVN